jgi:Amt family ammonium transporter
MSGSIAERTNVDTYLFFSFLMTSLVFPVACAWTWGNGWLYQIGFIDFAGSGIVHLIGALPGLVGTLFLGPRLGIYDLDLL